jgi:hypothetical protein
MKNFNVKHNIQGLLNPAIKTKRCAKIGKARPKLGSLANEPFFQIVHKRASLGRAFQSFFYLVDTSFPLLGIPVTAAALPVNNI